MKIKATINIEYEVNPDNYRYLDPSVELSIVVQAIELHKLHNAVAEVMPWPGLTVDNDGNIIPDDQVLEVKLEE